MWACSGHVMLLSESTFAIPSHMTGLNRYRREASSLFSEIYRSVLLGHEHGHEALGLAWKL